MVTVDLTKFGPNELRKAEALLKAKREQGLPEEFYENEIQIMCNTESRNVFFTNSEYQVAMMNGDKLESWYSCPVCGHEGFLEDMGHGEDDKDCQEYLNDIGFEE